MPEGAEIVAGAVLPCPCSLVRLYLDGKKLEQKVERACQGCWGMAHRSRCCLLLTSWLETRVRGAPGGVLWLSRPGGDGKKRSSGGKTSVTEVSLGCRTGQ